VSEGPLDLRIEYGGSVLGITERQPRLSWLLPAGAREQLAYAVEVGGWGSGRVESASSTFVPYGGPPLVSRQVVRWRVKVWTDRGESGWSQPAAFEVGLLEPSDWQAVWVSPPEDERPPAGARPAYLLRWAFELPTAPVRARIHATARGIYELFVNRRRVGDLELTPGFTSYHHRLDVQTHDATALLREGANTVCAVVSDGWYRGMTGFERRADCYGTEVALLTQVEVEGADGSITTVGTDGRWEATTGPIRSADLIAGERLDLRVRPGEWRPVRVVEHELGRLTSSPAPPVRRVEQLRPMSVGQLGPGRHLVDLGQNINGWLRLDDVGPAGTRLVITHGELLDDDGDLTTGHLAPFDFVTRAPLEVGQVDEVVAAGEPGERFEPRHTTHGFRYARSDSDERVNRLHDAAVWSFRGNACDVPTDCPQRERAAWTGDFQVFVPTAAFLYDVAGFGAKWLRSLADDQWPDGRVPNFVPDPSGAAAHDHPVAQFITGSAGWGDAAVIVPWELYVAYGDLRFLEQQFDSMVAWVGFAERRAAEGRHAARVARSATPRSHEQYLWDSGFHWGEWCEPGGNPAGLFTLESDIADVATAYLHRSSCLLARAAGVLGRDGDADRYHELATNARAAWQAEFIDDAGVVRPSTQANLVRALAFELVPDDLRASVADQLVELVRAAGNHVGTGFLATPFLLPVLADAGRADVAFDLLLQEGPPSWLHMVAAGATTIWENWEGLDAEGSGSLNHYSKGAVVSFLHRYVAGIRPDPSSPGYRRFRVEPLPGGGLSSATATLDSPYGRIRSAWQRTGDVATFEVEVPPGTTAEIVLPGGTRHEAGPGRFSWTAAC
jgi:alpha-L-rhamnosidase